MNERLWGPNALWWMAPAVLAGAPPGVLLTSLTLACIVRYGPSRGGRRTAPFPPSPGRSI